MLRAPMLRAVIMLGLVASCRCDEVLGACAYRSVARILLGKPEALQSIHAHIDLAIGTRRRDLDASLRPQLLQFCASLNEACARGASDECESFNEACARRASDALWVEAVERCGRSDECSYPTTSSGALARLRAAGFSPRLTVDVGAHVGDWAREARNLWPQTQILMLEAAEPVPGTLESVAVQLGGEAEVGGASFRNALVSAETGGRRPFFECALGSSVYQQQDAHDFCSGEAKILESVTLDDLLDAGQLVPEKLDFIKIDVQGSELDVLRGAKNALKRVSVIQLEFSVVDFNAGGACPSELDAHLRRAGFALYDVDDVSRCRYLFGSLGVGQYDAFYIRTGSAQLPDAIRAVQLCGGGAPHKDDDGALHHRVSALEIENAALEMENAALRRALTDVALGCAHSREASF
ncbi:S-adenosyl-L-methionine-dependent methyltransferase [Pelagophyceae sp. CCMP2097]|nr:S-adenosyl-L-methionine-dependent methyltransferase [Pelagophyceae sp. CCMP2097]|mmetsp:Transcript_20805/g.71503  ORF Transcript_20805/g.71503 Transcript_20805/m.71503 type:complete len:410 (+) Transcript_20805:83-1312(+)